MEATILIKYGLHEKISIDVTNQVLSSYITGNIIKILSKDFKTFAPTFFPDTTKFLFFNCKINGVEKKRCYIDDGEDVFIDLQKIQTFESQKK